MSQNVRPIRALDQSLPNRSQEANSLRNFKIPAAAARTKEKVRYCVTIKKPRQELYDYWRNFENLTSFMKDVERIEVTSPITSEWRVRLKSHVAAEWTAEITEDIPGEQISWVSTDDSDVKTQGSVWFMDAPADKGTVVGLLMNYKIPGGKISEFITKLSGEDPDTLALVNLRRFKALLETGEIPTIDGQPCGRDENEEEGKTVQ